MENKNLELYNKYAAVPENAKKTIKGGRLKGFTDINPMWRIKCLTEEFGPCGIGWKFDVTKQWIEQGAYGEICAFCNINLYVMVDGKWSEPIFGTGGSGFVQTQKGDLFTSDEAYKMALTDALSVACKMLGFGADVYWGDGAATKYDMQQQLSEQPPEQPQPQPQPQARGISEKDAMVIESMATQEQIPIEAICQRYKVNKLTELNTKQYVSVLKDIELTRLQKGETKR